MAPRSGVGLNELLGRSPVDDERRRDLAWIDISTPGASAKEYKTVATSGLKKTVACLVMTQ